MKDSDRVMLAGVATWAAGFGGAAVFESSWFAIMYVAGLGCMGVGIIMWLIDYSKKDKG